MNFRSDFGFSLFYEIELIGQLSKVIIQLGCFAELLLVLCSQVFLFHSEHNYLRIRNCHVFLQVLDLFHQLGRAVVKLLLFPLELYVTKTAGQPGLGAGLDEVLFETIL